MRGNWQLLIPIIAAAVWILTSLIRSAEDQRVRRARAQPEPEEPREPERPRRSASEIDRFLQEVQRRRRDTNERRPEPAAYDIPMAIPVEPATTAPLPRTTSRSTAERVARRRQVETASLPVAQLVVAPPVAAAAVWHEPPPPPAAVLGVQSVETVAPARVSIGKQLRALLRSPQTVGTAVVLREIFDRPLSQRRRG